MFVTGFGKHRIISAIMSLQYPVRASHSPIVTLMISVCTLHTIIIITLIWELPIQLYEPST